MTEETKEKMSLARKGKPLSEEHKRKIGESNKGKKLSEETKEKLSKSHLGKKLSEETKKKISKASKGRKPTLGKHWRLSEITKKKMSKNHRGEKCIFWKGGIWKNPYSVDWTATFKRAIRQRDKYTCQICGKEPAIYVHHIDYDKQNCNSNNLITLCQKCHLKTNGNREYWTKYFKQLILLNQYAK